MERSDGAGHSQPLSSQRSLPWWILPLLLLCFVGSTLPSLGTPRLSNHMEKVSLLSSAETWYRQHAGLTYLLRAEARLLPVLVRGLDPRLKDHLISDGGPNPRAWLMPTHNSLPRTHKPPLLVWTNMLAWTGLEPRTVSPDVLLWRARVVGVLLLASVLVSTYFIGRALVDHDTGMVGAVVAGTFLFTLRQAHFATYDTYQLALCTAAVAAALWGTLEQGRPVRGARVVIGWLVSGLLLGLAMLSKSLPIALALTCVPLVIVLVSQRQIRAIKWVVLAVLIAFGIAAPWYLWVLQTYPSSGERLIEEWRAERGWSVSIVYYLPVVLALSLPWTHWLITSLVHPWFNGRPTPANDVADPRHPPRRRLMPALLWFGFVFVVFSLHPAKAQRYLLPIIPPMALLIGQFWSWQMSLDRARLRDAHIGMLVRLHWIGLMVASIVVPAVLVAGVGSNAETSVVVNLLRAPTLAPAAGLALGVVLLVVAWVGWRVHRSESTHRWAAALLLTAAWMLLAVPVAHRNVYAGAEGHSIAHQHLPDITPVIGDRLFVQLRESRDTVELNADAIFYLKRMVPMLRAGQLDALRAQVDSPIAVMTDADPKSDPGAGRVTFRDGKDRPTRVLSLSQP